MRKTWMKPTITHKKCRFTFPNRRRRLFGDKMEWSGYNDKHQAYVQDDAYISQMVMVTDYL